MSFYLYSVLSHFLVPTLLFACLSWQAHTNPNKTLFYTSVISIVLGIIAYQNIPQTQTLALGKNGLDFVCIVLALLYAFIFGLTEKSLRFVFGIILLLTSYNWTDQAELSMLTATNVINTTLILNITSIVFGFILLALIFFVAQYITKQSPKPSQLISLLLVLVMLVPISGAIVLSMMKLQIIDLTPWRLSYVSKVTNFQWVAAYAALVLTGLHLITFTRSILLPQKQFIDKQKQPIQKRKSTAVYQHHRRFGRSHGILIVVTLFSLLYWDLIASRPESLSAATKVEVSADHQVHINIDKNDLLDGNLHRFAWVADDGKVVRFFIINRYPGQNKLAVVFDACLLCGDQGYIQKGNQVICLACGVHIFIPSIGKMGGCNPIPINDWSQDQQDVIIAKTVLETGLPYFSTIEELDVQDPITRAKLKNTTAKHKYDFGGKTYFFSSDKSYEQFRDNPEKYVGDK
ncbi:Fe-S-containing protein [Vibrio sp.]|nr:Fe-S-containing protein [Vibrio sp.]